MSEDDDTADEAEDIDALLRKFLESHPLYSAARFNVYKSAPAFRSSDQWPSALMLHCPQCKRDTTWARSKQAKSDIPFFLFQHDNKWQQFMAFDCVHCKQTRTAYWCQVDYEVRDEIIRYTVRKQGQSPAWSIAVPPSVAKALPAGASDFYRKGVICLSHDFGLAAVGYFRRVVEVVTEHLLDLVEQHAQSIADSAALEIVQDARRSHQATERLKHAASQIPPNLRVGGRNPLADLYDKYSESIHGMTDEECLAVSLDLRAALDYLLPALHDQLKAARNYEAALAKSKRRAKIESSTQ